MLAVVPDGCSAGVEMSQGRIIKLGKGASVKGGKVKVRKVYPNTSAKIAARKRPKNTFVRGAKD